MEAALLCGKAPARGESLQVLNHRQAHSWESQGAQGRGLIIEGESTCMTGLVTGGGPACRTRYGAVVCMHEVVMYT